MLKAYSKWAPWEHATMLRMKASGATNRQIALAVGRSHNAVTARLTDRFSRQKHAEPAAFVPVPSVTIAIAMVADFYEQGWRFAHFDKGLCVLVWPFKSEPRWPAEVQREAA